MEIDSVTETATVEPKEQVKKAQKKPRKGARKWEPLFLAAATTSRESNTRKGGYQKIITNTTTRWGGVWSVGAMAVHFGGGKWAKKGGSPHDLSHRTERN